MNTSTRSFNFCDGSLVCKHMRAERDLLFVQGRSAGGRELWRNDGRRNGIRAVAKPAVKCTFTSNKHTNIQNMADITGKVGVGHPQKKSVFLMKTTFLRKGFSRFRWVLFRF